MKIHMNYKIMGSGFRCSQCGANYNHVFRYCPDCGKEHNKDHPLYFDIKEYNLPLKDD